MGRLVVLVGLVAVVGVSSCGRDPATLPFAERPCDSPPAAVSPANVPGWLLAQDVQWHVAERRDDFEVVEGTTAVPLAELHARYERMVRDRDDTLVLFSEVEELDAEVVVQGPVDLALVQLRVTCRDRTDVRISVRDP